MLGQNPQFSKQMCMIPPTFIYVSVLRKRAFISVSTLRKGAFFLKFNFKIGNNSQSNKE